MLWSLGLLRQSAAAIVLCPRAECVVRLLFWLSGGLISVPSSICWPCLQTGGLESPKMVLRAVGQAAFGSAPSIGNSSYSLVCSTASDTFLSAHTSSQIRCSNFSPVLLPCHDTAVFFTLMNIWIFHGSLVTSKSLYPYTTSVGWLRISRGEIRSNKYPWMTRLNISGDPRGKSKGIKWYGFVFLVTNHTCLCIFWGNVLPGKVACAVLETSVKIAEFPVHPWGTEGDSPDPEQMASPEQIDLSTECLNSPNNRSDENTNHNENGRIICLSLPPFLPFKKLF